LTVVNTSGCRGGLEATFPVTSDGFAVSERVAALSLGALEGDDVSITNGGAFRGILIELTGRGGGVSPRFSVSFLIRIEPNSLGKSEVNVDCAEEIREYGLCPAEEVGLIDRGSVGAARPDLVGPPANGAIGDEGETVLGVRGGVLLAKAE
jgi:hypothetical protein